MKRSTRFPASRFCLLAAGVIAVWAVAPLQAQIIERVIVKVNGEIFTKTDLETRQVSALRDEGASQQMGDAELRKRVDAMTPQLLVDAVDEMLLVQRAKELGPNYRMTDEQFNDVLKDLKTRNKIETDEQLQAALKGEGLTLGDLRKSIERRFMVEQVERAEIFSRINVSEDEIKRYYAQHPVDFTSVPTVTLREILVRVPGDGKTVNVGLDEEAKQKAESIRDRALKGESFEKLTDLSDAPSKANGGLIGPISRGDLEANFAKTLATMKVGDISPVLRTPAGYDVVKLEAATETKVLPYEEARQQIADRVYGAKQQAAFEAYIKKLRAAAILDWKVPEFKKLYDEQVARTQAAPIPGLAQ
jgi:peptidyl-prolyl cis-trans isomerase SurA